MKPFDVEKLTPNFARWEFVVSETAARRQIDNTPSLDQWANLKALAETCLEPARAALGPLHINSGYRSPALNAAIGGAPNSQHMYGEAADTIGMSVPLHALFKWFYYNAQFDQLILEFSTWVHVSHKRDGAQRHQALLAYKKNGHTIYAPITQDQMDAL